MILAAIKIYAALALLFPACWAVVGYRHNKRRKRIVISVRCGAADVYPEPLPIIKAEPTIWQ